MDKTFDVMTEGPKGGAEMAEGEKVMLSGQKARKGVLSWQSTKKVS